MPAKDMQPQDLRARQRSPAVSGARPLSRVWRQTASSARHYNHHRESGTACWAHPSTLVIGEREAKIVRKILIITP